MLIAGRTPRDYSLASREFLAVVLIRSGVSVIGRLTGYFSVFVQYLPFVGLPVIGWAGWRADPSANIGYAGTVRIDLQAQAFSALTAASGLGPDGTPGRSWTTQVGLVGKPVHHNKPLDDGYPVEFVKITTVGN